MTLPTVSAGIADDDSTSCFFYGTLMAKAVLYRVIYGTRDPQGLDVNLKIESAILEGYCRRRVEYADYPGITPEDGKTVLGTYVTGLTKMDMHRLDVFEGSEYIKKKVKLDVLDSTGKVVRQEDALTYVFLHPDMLEDQEWDFEHFQRERMHIWTGESKEFAG